MTQIRNEPDPSPLDIALDAIKEALSRLSFGEVSITVHDSRIVQFEVTEKRRFAR